MAVKRKLTESTTNKKDSFCVAGTGWLVIISFDICKTQTILRTG